MSNNVIIDYNQATIGIWGEISPDVTPSICEALVRLKDQPITIYFGCVAGDSHSISQILDVRCLLARTLSGYVISRLCGFTPLLFFACDRRFLSDSATIDCSELTHGKVFGFGADKTPHLPKWVRLIPDPIREH